RGRQAAGVPMQQAHAQRALQSLQALAGDRDREAEAACRGADRAQVEHPQEEAQVADAVVHYQEIIDIDSPSWLFLLKMQRPRLRASRFRNPPRWPPPSPPARTCRWPSTH